MEKKTTAIKWLILAVLITLSVSRVMNGGIPLGLDLKGGTSFILGIDEEATEQMLRDRVVAEITDTQIDEALEEALKVVEEPVSEERRAELRESVRQGLVDKKVAEKLKDTLKDAQDRALEVMRNRIDGLGIKEPRIQAQGDNRIIIQLPGIDKEMRDVAEATLEGMAFLEFRMVHPDNETLVKEMFDRGDVPRGYKLVQTPEGPRYKRDKIQVADDDKDFRRDLRRWNAPAGHELLLERRNIGETEYFIPAFVERRCVMKGSALENADVGRGEYMQPQVGLEFNSEGKKLFRKVTTDYAPGGRKNPSEKRRRQLAIVMDGRLYSAPAINQPIFGGNARITGSFSEEEVRQLVIVLRSGSLPAPVKRLETTIVDPSLGKDSINSGIKSITIGGIVVLSFMLFYYLLAGLIANTALAMNMVLLPLGAITVAGFLSMGGLGVSDPLALPVLTLPGIAGILLTVGMAVDANVLIFERIREESRSGKRLVTAIKAGYERAFLTILDANVTTLITGIVLFKFGSGPIRGFAITLCAGILVSMYTSLVVTRMIFDLISPKMKATSLKMLRLIGQTNINFIGKRAIAAALSILVIAGTWTWVVKEGMQDISRVLGVDFRGGSLVTLDFEQSERENLGVDAIRGALISADIRESHIQYSTEMKQGGISRLKVSSGFGEASKVAESLAKAFPVAQFTVAQTSDIGPSIGKELKGKAVKAIIFALLGIVIYISLRFKLGFAVGAIVALTHDVMVTIGIYTLCGRQLSLPVVAALLTIVGYSVNDTIVVFDRIREDLKLVRNKSFAEICNLSINQTLSRTVLTSLTTLLAVIMLLVFGGGAINDFALALFIGIIVGTYSSIFVATPVVLFWHRGKLPEMKVKPSTN